LQPAAAGLWIFRYFAQGCTLCYYILAFQACILALKARPDDPVGRVFFFMLSA
jgi:hypothetical protein